MDYKILWAVVVVLFVLIELFTFNLVALWFVFGSVVAFALAFFVDSFITQILVFGIVSLISLIITKPLADKYMVNKIVKNNADYIIGKKGVITKAPTKTVNGQAKVDGKQWTVCSDAKIEVDDEIEVLSIDGVKLKVRKVKS